MSRLYLERRNRDIYVEVERRKQPPKEVALKFGVTYNNLRQILFRFKRTLSVTKSNTISL